MKFSSAFLIAVQFIFSISTGQPVIKIQDVIVDHNALTIDGNFGQAINGKSFQQDVMVTCKNYQYLAYYDENRHVCLTRRKLPNGKWQTIKFLDYDFKSNDAHNTISLGICPNDGTIHLAFDHHGHSLHYRKSKKDIATNPELNVWDATVFDPIVSELEKGLPIKITYPRFFQTPDGELQFCYRRGGSGRGDRMLVDYDSDSGTWENTRQIDSGTGLFKDNLGESITRCSYPNGYTYDTRGNLHVTWVWRESSQGANHDLVYVYSSDKGKTWMNNNDEILSEIPHVNTPGIKVAGIGREYGLMNTHGQAVDSKGRIHVVVWHCSAESLQAAGSKPGEERWGPLQARRYHHYWRNTNGKWQHRELPWIAGSRPKLFIDKNDNVFMVYGSRNTSLGSTEKPVHAIGDLIITSATANSGYKDWRKIHVEKGPFVNEMLGDSFRWKDEGILSLMVQEMPAYKHQPTKLRVLDFSVVND